MKRAIMSVQLNVILPDDWIGEDGDLWIEHILPSEGYATEWETIKTELIDTGKDEDGT